MRGFVFFMLITINSVFSQNKSSYLDIYESIISPKCSVSSCHDGSFEPDYRTAQSAYTTLVYHEVVKNNLQEEFVYRVVPFDTTRSLFFERLTNCCFVNEGDQMPLLQERMLGQNEIAKIANWISDGARDWRGLVPTIPE